MGNSRSRSKGDADNEFDSVGARAAGGGDVAEAGGAARALPTVSRPPLPTVPANAHSTPPELEDTFCVYHNERGPSAFARHICSWLAARGAARVCTARSLRVARGAPSPDRPGGGGGGGGGGGRGGGGAEKVPERRLILNSCRRCAVPNRPTVQQLLPGDVLREPCVSRGGLRQLEELASYVLPGAHAGRVSARLPARS